MTPRGNQRWGKNIVCDEAARPARAAGQVELSVHVALGALSQTALAPLAASRALAVAEHLRLPYAVERVPLGVRGAHDGWAHRLSATGGGRLLWPREAQLARPPGMLALRLPGREELPLCVRVLSDERVAALLGPEAGDWSPVAPIRDRHGHAASIWRSAEGDVLLPFDPDEAVENLWTERYVEAMAGSGRGPAARLMLRGYYAVRRALPRRTQIWMRRHYARVQARRPFPRWPAEPALHDFLELFLAILADISGQPVPYIAPWPDGHEWALVLTHDVETARGLERIEPLLALERSLGLRSAWYFVPRRYDVPEEQLSTLRAEGCEVGVHGLHHDGRDLRSLGRLRERLPAMRAAAERWGAVGFRSPALHRHWDWMPMLGFDHDSSYPDCDPYEPQPGGCCSWWPVMNRELVELPLTMPQDHTLFTILGHQDESAWVSKAQLLRRRGGMALVLTHPDYLGDGRALAAYRRLLERYGGDPAAWKALPAEVSAWWRRRHASRIVSDGRTWGIEGPAAAEARIEYAQERAWC